MTEIGVIAVREEAALEPSFWAQFPGNSQYIPRKALISSANFASLASFHNHPVGRAGGNHWGPAVTLLETTAASPYYFNFHKGDLGNFLVIGPSGSGKTVVLNFLIAQAERFEPTIVFFDKDRGAEIFLRAIGGRYDLIRPGVRTGFNPLQLPDTPGNRRFLQQWAAKLVTSNGEILSRGGLGDDLRRRSAPTTTRRRTSGGCAISASCSSAGAGRRRAISPRASIRGSATATAPGCSTTRTTISISTARIVGFDMTHLLDDPVVRTPTMMYLFHRVEERLDGQPSIIVVDEGWKALDDEVFVARIRDWEKTIRKRNGIVGFATQSTADALESRIATAVIEQSATQIFLPNPKAQEARILQGLRPVRARVRPDPHPARHLALLPGEARRRKRRGAAQSHRPARPADRAVGPRAHRAHARRPARRSRRRSGGVDAAAGGGGALMAFCPAPPE